MAFNCYLYEIEIDITVILTRIIGTKYSYSLVKSHLEIFQWALDEYPASNLAFNLCIVKQLSLENMEYVSYFCPF